MESTCPTPPGSSTHLLLLQVAGGELHLLQLPRTQLEPAVGSAKVLVQLVVQIHPDAHQHCEATAGPLPWAPGVVNQPWRGKKKKAGAVSKFACEGITVPASQITIYNTTLTSRTRTSLSNHL